MARIERKFSPPHSARLNRSLAGFGRPASRWAVLRVAGLSLATVLAMTPPAFAQRGGGGGGGSAGGGSHGGGGLFGTVSSSGSHSGGADGTYSGSGNGARASSRTANLTGAPEGFGGKTRASGARAAFLRFFGLGHAPVEKQAEPVTSTAVLVKRAAASAKLPPIFSRIWLRDSRAAFGSPVSTTERRLPPPLPRRLPPIVYGGGYGWYGPALGFDFGFPLLFDLNFFDYFNWFPSWQPHVHALPTMLLYLNDGSALEVTDYWVEGVNLDYVTEGDEEGTVPIANLDIQRTSDANTRLGFRFALDRTHRGMPLDRVEPTTPQKQPSQPDQSEHLNLPAGPQQAKPPVAQQI